MHGLSFLHQRSPHYETFSSLESCPSSSHQTLCHHVADAGGSSQVDSRLARRHDGVPPCTRCHDDAAAMARGTAGAVGRMRNFCGCAGEFVQRLRLLERGLGRIDQRDVPRDGEKNWPQRVQPLPRPQWSYDPQSDALGANTGAVGLCRPPHHHAHRGTWWANRYPG